MRNGYKFKRSYFYIGALVLREAKKSKNMFVRSGGYERIKNGKFSHLCL